MVKDLKKKQEKKRGKKARDLKQDITLKQDQLSQILGASVLGMGGKVDRSGTEVEATGEKDKQDMTLQNNPRTSLT